MRIVQRLGLPWRYKFLKNIRPFNLVIRAMLVNMLMDFIRRFLSDHVVYQSLFVREYWEKFYGKVKTPSSIIYNGVDLDKFNPEGPSYKSNADICIISVEGNQGNDSQNIALNAGRHLIERGYDVEVLMLGNIPDKVKTCYQRHLFIKILGHIKNDEFTILL